MAAARSADEDETIRIPTSAHLLHQIRQAFGLKSSHPSTELLTSDDS